MKVRVIIQINAEGTKHVTFTSDMLSAVEDFLLTAPGWENAEVYDQRLLLFCDDSALAQLLDEELHSAYTTHESVEDKLNPIILQELKAINETAHF